MKPKFTVIFSITAVTLQSMWLKCIISNCQLTIGHPLDKMQSNNSLVLLLKGIVSMGANAT